MAMTALNVNGKKLMAMSTTEDVGLVVLIYQAKDDFQAYGSPEHCVKTGTEEEFHRALRKDAHAKGHLVKDRCTDPEWNPE